LHPTLPVAARFTARKELEPSGRLKGIGLLTNAIGNALETTIALSHLIFEGTLDRFRGSRSVRRMAAASCRPMQTARMRS